MRWFMFIIGIAISSVSGRAALGQDRLPELPPVSATAADADRPSRAQMRLIEDVRQAITEGDLAALAALLKEHPDLATTPRRRYGNEKPTSGDNYPPLHFALLARAKPEIVKLLVERGASPDSTCPDGSAMHLAARYSEIDVIKVLLAKGVDLNGGAVAPAMTPLQVAIMRPKDGLDVAKLLVEKGAKVDALSAAGLGRVDVLKKLIATDPNAATAANDAGLTPIQYAAAGGQAEAVKLLLENKAAPDGGAKKIENHHIVRLSNPTLTPLHLAVMHEHAEIVALLIAHKADVEATDDVSRTPIFYARDTKCIELLVKAGAKLEHIDGFGDTPLLLAATMGDTAQVKALLAAKADPNAPKGPITLSIPSLPGQGPGRNPGGATTALHLAAELGHAEIVAALIKAGTKVNAQDPDGRTPLDLALSYKQEKAAKVLRDNGGT